MVGNTFLQKLQPKRNKIKLAKTVKYTAIRLGTVFSLLLGRPAQSTIFLSLTSFKVLG